MLTHRDRLAPALVDAKIHTAARASDLRVSRFGIVIDERGYECGAVSDRYKLVRNADLVSAVDLASDTLGIDLECGASYYRRGRASYDFLMPEEWQVPGDKSKLRSRFTLFNGYGGTDKIRGTGGTFRLICSNGMSVGEVYAAINQRHVGTFDLLELVQDMMVRTLRHVERERERAVIMAQTPFEYNVPAGADEDERETRSRNYKLIEAIGKDTPKKYKAPLRDAIYSYRRDVGHTVWAITQAIAEIARHDRKNTPTAQAWARRNQERILEAVGV